MIAGLVVICWQLCCLLIFFPFIPSQLLSNYTAKPCSITKTPSFYKSVQNVVKEEKWAYHYF